jgi:primase-polymerase (primpol)-like protein
MHNQITTDKFPHYPENVPAALKTGERWVTCDEYKVPLIAVPNGACFAASSTNKETWRPYETALATWQENEHITGLGRVICDDEDYVGVDLDDCVEPETGELVPWAATIAARLDSYTEVSPSLKGVKIWVRAPELTTAYKKPEIEIYPARRYFTVTGLTFGAGREIRAAGETLAAIIEEEFPKVDRDRSPYNGPDRVLDLEEFLGRANVEVLSVLSDGAAERKYRILCPWLDEHSDGDDTGTYCGQYDNGALFFACWHSHCASRRWQEFRALLNPVVFLGRPSRSKCVRGGRLR